MLSPRRRITLLIIAASLLSPLVVMLIYVDDWSRDLTTNRAHTTPGGRFEPWELGVTPDRLAEMAERLGAPWRLANEQPLPDDSPLPALYEGEEPAAIHHLVRTTGLMGYQDDAWLVVIETDRGVRLYAESRSRLGRGDLGQNPRNLAELFDALRQLTIPIF